MSSNIVYNVRMSLLSKQACLLRHKLEWYSTKYILLIGLWDVSNQYSADVVLSTNVGNGVDVKEQVPVCYLEDREGLRNCNVRHGLRIVYLCTFIEIAMVPYVSKRKTMDVRK